MSNNEQPLTKTELAKRLGVSRASLYYKHKQPAIDEEVKRQIESVLADHPSYGHKRIALALKLNKKRILRVMKKFKIKPHRRRKGPSKPDDQSKPVAGYPNAAMMMCAIVVDYIWVSDFTYIKYKTYFIYLATIMDQYSREVVGWNVSR
jgi:putative transposase